MICARCNRTLKRDPVRIGELCLGPKCARAMFGAKPERVKREPVKRDALTADLFEGVAE